MRFAYFLLLLSAVAISADLQSDIKDIVDRLPKDRLREVTQQYAADLSQRSGRSFFDSFSLQRFLAQFIELSDVKNIFDYFKDRGIDFKVILFRLIPELLGHSSIFGNADFGNSQQGNGKTVVSGNFVNDLLRAVPIAELTNLVEEKIQLSPEFAEFAKAVKDPKFKQILYRALNSKAFYQNDADTSYTRGLVF